MNFKTKTAIAFIFASVLLTACGNATAKNEQNKDTAKNTAVVELTTEAFKANVYDINSDKLVYLGNKPAIIDFNATWCGPCRRIAPILDELAKEYEGKIVIYKVDVDKNREIAEVFGISSIPAILYIPLDKEPVMTIGLRGKAKMKEEINTILMGE